MFADREIGEVCARSSGWEEPTSESACTCHGGFSTKPEPEGGKKVAPGAQGPRSVTYVSVILGKGRSIAEAALRRPRSVIFSEG